MAWEISDCNGPRPEKEGTFLRNIHKHYRPIWIDEGGKHLFYIGDASKDPAILDYARMCVNAHEYEVALKKILHLTILHKDNLGTAQIIADEALTAGGVE